MTLKHNFVSPVTDGGDAGLVGPDEWNYDHVVSGTSLQVQYNNAGSLTGMAGTTWDSANRNFTLNSAGSDASTAGAKIAVLDDGTWWGFAIETYGNNNFADGMLFVKSRNSTYGAQTALQSGDQIQEWRFRGSDGTASLRAATYFVEIDGAVSTGSMPGRVRWLTTPSGSATPLEALRLTSEQSVVCNNAAISTSATGGFLYIPTCAGTPTGTPTTFTGRVPIVYDSTNHERYVYDGGWCVETQRKRVSADVSYTSTTTLANITGLSANVLAGRTYHFRAHLLVKSGASAGGVKAAISGTATATDIRYDGWSKDTGGTGTHAYTQASALGGAVADSTPTSDTTTLIMEGVITVNAAGTLTAQAAQSTSSLTATVIARGSTLIVTEVA